jgi:hypothetical protein
VLQPRFRRGHPNGSSGSWSHGATHAVNGTAAGPGS